MIALLGILPLLVTFVLVTAAVFYICKKKSLAQSQCIQHSVKTQNSLRKMLKKILQMNPSAKRLQQRRLHADANLVQALAGGNPALIAGAKAIRDLVILQQLEFGARQRGLLRLADLQRQRRDMEFYAQGYRHHHKNLETRHGQPTALAVKAYPVHSLSPEYQLSPDFTRKQALGYRYAVDLKPPFWNGFLAAFTQTIECSISLTRSTGIFREGDWDIKILKASAE